MKGKIFTKQNIISSLGLISFFIYMYVAFQSILAPKPLTGDNISTEKNIFPVEFRFIKADEDFSNLYIFDDQRNDLYILTSEGNIITTLDFDFGLSVNVQEINEEESYIIFYLSQYKEYYQVGFDGEIIKVTSEDAPGYIRGLELITNYNDYELKNFFFFHSLYEGENRLLTKPSISPVVALVIITFFGSLFMSQKYIGETISDGKELKMFGIFRLPKRKENNNSM